MIFTKKPEPQGEKPVLRRPIDDFSRLRTPLPWNVYINRAIGNEAVLRFLEPTKPQGFVPIQRQVEEEEEEEALQAKEVSGDALEATPEVESAINTLEGGGQLLPESDLAFFGSRFGCDLSHVRLHTDTKSAELASRINARAFTWGSDVVFGTGQYAPGTDEGYHLLAHELTHVIQQAGKDPMIHRWAQEGVSKILCKNEGKGFIEKLNQLKIYEYKSIKCKYKHVDKEGNWEVITEESDGESDPETGEVYIRKDLSDKEASSTLFHEVTHLRQKEKKGAFKKGQGAPTEEERKLEKQKNEYDAWIKAEQYRIRAGLPEQQPGFRSKKGKTYVVNEAKVREYVDSLYTRTAPEQKKGYSRIGCYEEGLEEVKTQWKCPNVSRKGRRVSGKQEVRRFPAPEAPRAPGNKQIQRTVENDEPEEGAWLSADQPDLGGAAWEQRYTPDSEIATPVSEAHYMNGEGDEGGEQAGPEEGDIFAPFGTGGAGLGNVENCKTRRNECYWKCLKFHMYRFPPDPIGFADCKKNCCDWAYGECLKNGSFPCVFGKSV
ncbi:MAG: hypothetical protein A4E58_01882 [Syntrophorhabdus sp. PtaB.Bin006]|nr:MAG: hypothetical protein A4E58_01882 [Syntrophorhabdus sp. PtaB.Bin006]